MFPPPSAGCLLHTSCSLGARAVAIHVTGSPGALCDPTTLPPWSPPGPHGPLIFPQNSLGPAGTPHIHPWDSLEDPGTHPHTPRTPQSRLGPLTPHWDPLDPSMVCPTSLWVPSHPRRAPLEPSRMPWDLPIHPQDLPESSGALQDIPEPSGTPWGPCWYPPHPPGTPPPPREPPRDLWCSPGLPGACWDPPHSPWDPPTHPPGHPRVPWVSPGHPRALWDPLESPPVPPTSPWDPHYTCFPRPGDTSSCQMLWEHWSLTGHLGKEEMSERGTEQGPPGCREEDKGAAEQRPTVALMGQERGEREMKCHKVPRRWRKVFALKL